MIYDLQAAIDDVAQTGGEVVLPAGPVTLARPVYLAPTAPPVVVRGALEGSYGTHTGSTLGASQLDPDTEYAIRVEGKAHRWRDFRLTGAPKGGMRWSTSYGALERVGVDYCGEHGFYLDGKDEAGDGDYSHCWASRVSQCRSAMNGGHGFLSDGASCGLHIIELCDARKNGGAGFFESSFLGDTLYQVCHTSGNDISYEVQGNANRAQFLHCYAELDQRYPKLGAYNLVVGGDIAWLIAHSENPNAQRVGTESLLRYEGHGHTVAIPASAGPMVTQHRESAEWWRVADRYEGSMPWLKYCRLPLRRESGPFAALAITDERHPLGPDLLQRGAPSAGTTFRKVLTQTAELDAVGAAHLTYQDLAFSEYYPGTPKQFVTVAGKGAAVETQLDRPAKRYHVWVEGTPGATVTVDVLTERWA